MVFACAKYDNWQHYVVRTCIRVRGVRICEFSFGAISPCCPSCAESSGARRAKDTWYFSSSDPNLPFHWTNQMLWSSSWRPHLLSTVPYQALVIEVVVPSLVIEHATPAFVDMCTAPARLIEHAAPVPGVHCTTASGILFFVHSRVASRWHQWSRSCGSLSSTGRWFASPLGWTDRRYSYSSVCGRDRRRIGPVGHTRDQRLHTIAQVSVRGYRCWPSCLSPDTLHDKRKTNWISATCSNAKRTNLSMTRSSFSPKRCVKSNISWTWSANGRFLTRVHILVVISLALQAAGYRCSPWRIQVQEHGFDRVFLLCRHREGNWSNLLHIGADYDTELKSTAAVDNENTYVFHDRNMTLRPNKSWPTHATASSGPCTRWIAFNSEMLSRFKKWCACFFLSVPSGQCSTANCGAHLKRCFWAVPRYPFRTAFTSDCGVDVFCFESWRCGQMDDRPSLFSFLLSVLRLHED